ncbi:undecaprenyldiphospho-muramoylpentapeptide beta-N-acetylglucosaminyltransferase [Lutibacter sp. B2]|nr:undecaprenyldiphospho-muramoylpentapeptide beta-N-acetylglucosaminyltransferase [Lutibacter sp. B2]
MKVLITGGGTGGHIYPAIAIANKIKDEIKNAQILFVGTEKGLESQLVPNEGYRFKTITVSGFKRRLSKDTVKSAFDLFCGIKDAIKIIKDFKPDLVIGTGGYVCGPVVFVASMLNIKTIIHEQNVIPGVTNKILSKFVNKILVSFDESKEYFNHSNKVVVAGNPVRKDFIHTDKNLSRKELEIEEQNFVVLSFGGSRGAEKINDAMINVLNKLKMNKEITIIHVTGSIHYKKVLEKLKQCNFSQNQHGIVKEYVHDMAKFMSAADFVICRSGAITLAEVTAMGLPSILIPSPYVTNNHQELNARVLEKNGAAVLLKEKELTGEEIVKLINRFNKNRDELSEMAVKSKELEKINATDIIYSNILSILKS